MNKHLAVIFSLLMIGTLLYAEDRGDEGYLGFIGMSLADSYSRYGIPEEVGVLRGTGPEGDAVVFYRQGCYLYWYENRVWQVRFDKSFQGMFQKIAIGMNMDTVEGLLGTPWKRLPDSILYIVENYDFPVRLRLFFNETRLYDAYLYRGDY